MLPKHLLSNGSSGVSFHARRARLGEEKNTSVTHQKGVEDHQEDQTTALEALVFFLNRMRTLRKPLLANGSSGVGFHASRAHLSASKRRRGIGKQMLLN